MEKNHIESIMENTLSGMRSMIDVDTIIGSPVVTDNTTIIPISKLTYGFVSGGGEFPPPQKSEDTPYAGGTGAGVNITPSAFLILAPEGARLLPVNDSTVLDRVMDLIPQLMERIRDWVDTKPTRDGEPLAPNEEL
ncbi:MAG: GerW family sporulation protein [Eubacteriales bacterium]|nr:GerW family sporulation protein [Eubacteriales bacterium]